MSEATPQAEGRWVQAPDRQLAFQRPDGTLWRQAPDGTWVSVTAIRRKRRKWPWVLAAVVILAIVIPVVAIATAVNNLTNEQAQHAITQSQFNSVQLGISHAQLRSQLGKSPEDAQAFVSQGVLGSNQINSSCVYYNELDHPFGSYYQFCFNGDSLNSKNSY